MANTFGKITSLKTAIIYQNESAIVGPKKQSAIVRPNGMTLFHQVHKIRQKDTN